MNSDNLDMSNREKDKRGRFESDVDKHIVTRPYNDKEKEMIAKFLRERVISQTCKYRDNFYICRCGTSEYIGCTVNDGICNKCEDYKDIQ